MQQYHGHGWCPFYNALYGVNTNCYDLCKVRQHVVYSVECVVKRTPTIRHMGLLQKSCQINESTCEKKRFTYLIPDLPIICLATNEKIIEFLQVFCTTTAILSAIMISFTDIHTTWGETVLNGWKHKHVVQMSTMHFSYTVLWQFTWAVTSRNSCDNAIINIFYPQPTCSIELKVEPTHARKLQYYVFGNSAKKQDG